MYVTPQRAPEFWMDQQGWPHPASATGLEKYAAFVGARTGCVPLAGLGQTEISPAVRVAYGVVSTASMAASAYHGYRRNNSIGWALWWGLMGALFPILVPVLAVAQGFGKRR
jgi:hypothetical protein